MAVAVQLPPPELELLLDELLLLELELLLEDELLELELLLDEELELLELELLLELLEVPPTVTRKFCVVCAPQLLV